MGIPIDMVGAAQKHRQQRYMARHPTFCMHKTPNPPSPSPSRPPLTSLRMNSCLNFHECTATFKLIGQHGLGAACAHDGDSIWASVGG